LKLKLPGFIDRADAVALYEARLGRCLVDMEWHEIFALVRSTAIAARQARIAEETGQEYPVPAGDDSPVLRHLWRLIEASDR
ncbi:MAG: hypothetical protein ACRD1G_06065, partial [Acidimicrobiales bacterium]